MQKNSDNFSMQEALRLAESDAGQQLLAMLQQQKGNTLDKAIAQAGNGDYENLKKTLGELMASPEAQALIKQLRG